LKSFTTSSSGSPAAELKIAEFRSIVTAKTNLSGSTIRMACESSSTYDESDLNAGCAARPIFTISASK
jgi:hypothetical protein